MQERVGDAFGEPVVLAQVLPDGAMQRKEEWDKYREAKGFHDAFLADLDHHPQTKGPGGSTLFPTMVTHGSIFSWQKQRLATTAEMIAVHGAHVLKAPKVCGSNLH